MKVEVRKRQKGLKLVRKMKRRDEQEETAICSNRTRNSLELSNNYNF